MNVVQLINKVLVGLRKDRLDDAATSVTDKFHLLVLQLLNDAKEEIEEMWDWYALRADVSVSVIAGTNDYELVGTNERSRLVYERVPGTGSRAAAFDVTSGSKNRMSERALEYVQAQHKLDPSAQTQNIVDAFAVYTDGETLRIKLWPTPSESRTLTLRVVIPQDELAEDALDTELTIPGGPVWRRALVEAVGERGEELGEPLERLSRRAENSLVDAIFRERSDDDNTANAV